MPPFRCVTPPFSRSMACHSSDSIVHISGSTDGRVIRQMGSLATPQSEDRVRLESGQASRTLGFTVTMTFGAAAA